MIVKIYFVLALSVFIKDVSCASFSKVYMQRNGLDYPVEYVQYASPSVAYSPQIAQLTSPVSSVISPNYVPCGTPCVYPSQVAPLASVTSVAPSAPIVQYQAPSLPIVVAPSRSEPSGYQYSYVVYDEQTGDHKVQQEQSDGSIVRGGYSFLQPDGYVREVQYTADDIQGFNAVVKNYLPTTTESNKPEQIEPVPCVDTKNEKLTDVPNKKEIIVEVSTAIPEEPYKINPIIVIDTVSTGNSEEPVIIEPIIISTVSTDKPEDSTNIEAIVDTFSTDKPEDPVKVEFISDGNDNESVDSCTGETCAADFNPKPSVNPPTEIPPTPTPVSPLELLQPDNIQVGIPEKIVTPCDKILLVDDSEVETSQGEFKPPYEQIQGETTDTVTPSESLVLEITPTKPPQEQKIELTTSILEPGPYIIESTEDSLASTAVAMPIPTGNILVSYNDIIKCVQSAISGYTEGIPIKQTESPLTYIVLNKPC